MSPSAWTGFHYDGRTANREPVTVTLTAQGLHLSRADGETALWPYNELRRTGGVPRSQLRLERMSDPPEAVVLDATDLLSVLREISPDDAARLRVVSGTIAPSPRAMAWAVLGAVVLVAGYFFGLPAFAAWVAPRIPAKWEEELGRATVDRLAPAYRRCTDSLQLAAIRQILGRLLATQHADTAAFTVTVADDSVVNAFAAPGRFLVVNLGLLRAAKTPEELAGVLAHEAQHAQHHHPTRAIAREIPMQIFLAAISGGNEGVAAAARAAGTLGTLRYQRNDELEADTDGMKMIQAARVDPRGMVDFMRELGRRYKDLPPVASYLSSHPLSGDRAARLARLAAQAQYQPVPLIPDAVWVRAQRGCHS